MRKFSIFNFQFSIFALIAFSLLITYHLSLITSVSAQTVQSSPVTTIVGNASPTTTYTTPGAPGTRPTAPAPVGDLRQAIIAQFGITMNGYSSTQLQWAWEKFWEVSNTNFNKLTRGSKVDARPGTLSQQTGCKTAEVGVAFNDPTLFKVILTHELGHIIYWCNDDTLVKRSQHHNIFTTEGGVTGYGATGCLGTLAYTEDFAEMIAYYLNPGVVEQTARCGNRGQIPFANGKFPLHFNLAKSILGEY